MIKHKVKGGETLSSISLFYYGAANRWLEIADANKDSIADFNKIYPNQEIIIPNIDRKPVVHDLKIEPEFLTAIIDGSKTFEVRKNDRGYQVGDKLSFWSNIGEDVLVTVTYVLEGGRFGIDKDYCVLGIRHGAVQPFLFVDSNVEESWLAREADLNCPCCNGSGHVDDTRKYHHIKRGTEYTFIGEAKLQTETPLSDNAEVVVYQGDDGKLWVRSKKEFFDGRFKAVQP